MKFSIYSGIALLAVSAAIFSNTDSGIALSPASQQSKTQGMNCDAMNERGDQAMGFSHMKATHHFRLTSGGGAIEIEANGAQDKATRDEIRMHLAHIAQMFADGNFNAPLFIHDQTPPGVPVMQRLRAEIRYEFEKMPRGGRLRVTTSNAEALAAIQDFFRFQIKEHKTGDPLEMKN
jgi:hypothetical protein